MKKAILSLMALTLLASASAFATSPRLSITCSAGKGDNIMSVTYHMFNGISVDKYASSFVFPKSSIIQNDDSGIFAHVEEMTRYSEGEEMKDKNVKLHIKFIKSTNAGTLLLVEELTMNGETKSSSDVRILKCN